MAYKLNKTDGTLLTELVDGQIDTTSCDLTLIGRNYVGFGEAFNENLIKLLENFASTGAPTTPITGQLWYDKSESRLKVYDGTAFKSNGPIVQNTQPQMVSGDIWINNSTNQLYFFDGTDLVLVGPVYTNSQALSGWQVATVRDTSGTDHTLLKMYVGGTLVSFISFEQFRPTTEEKSKLGITDEQIKIGMTFIDKDNFQVYGIAESTESLITDTIDPETGLRKRKSAGQFLSSDENDFTTGSLFIQNDEGLALGEQGETTMKVTSEGTLFRNVNLNDTFRYRFLGNTDYDGLVITPSNRGFGINLVAGANPESTLDVNGSTIIRGDLTVLGSNTVIQATTLSIDDYNIELGDTDTIITLDSAVSSSLSGALVDEEIITQGTTGATGYFKAISSDRQTITLEPRSGLFLAGAYPLTGASTGTLYQTDLATPVQVASVAQRTDSTADGAGIIVKGEASVSDANDKYIKWTNDVINGTNWEVSDNLNLVEGKAYKIDDVTMIKEESGGSFHELGVAIEEAPGLREVGIMDRVRVHSSMLLDELSGIPSIVTSTGLTIDSSGSITVTNGGSDVKITGLATTQYYTGDPSDAANKDYVDTQMESNTIALVLDTTDMPQAGFATVDDQIIDIITFLHPPYELRENTFARVHTTSFRGAVSGINVQDAIQVSSIGVDFSDLNTVDPYGVPPTNTGSNNQQLIDAIGFTSAVDGDVTLKADDGATPTPVSTRTKRFFKVVDNGGNKVWQSSAQGPYGENPGDSIPPVGWTP